MTTPAEWKQRVEELRELAEETVDPERRKRYLEFAGRWEEFLADLEHEASQTAHAEVRGRALRQAVQ